MAIGKRGGKKKAARTAFKNRDRQRKAAKLYLAGKTQQEIAAEVGASQKTISRDLNAADKEWAQATIGYREQWRAEGLARLEVLYKKALEAEEVARDAWERSKNPAKTVRQESTLPPPKDGADPIPTGDVKTTVTTEAQVGDPRFLKVWLETISERRQIEVEVSKLRKLYGEQHGGDDEPIDVTPQNVLVIRVRKPA